MRKVINLSDYLKEGTDNLAEQLRMELELGIIGIEHVKADVIIDILKRIGFEEDVNIVKSVINNCRPTLDEVEAHLKELVIMEVEDEKDDQLTIAEHLIANSWKERTNVAMTIDNDVVMTMDNVLAKSENLHPSIVVLNWYMHNHTRYLEKKERTQEGSIKKNEKKSFYLLVDKVYFNDYKDIEPKQQLYFLYHHDKDDNK